MKYKKHILFAGIASAALFASSLQAQLIVNGDFEADDISGFSNSVTPASWTVTAGPLLDEGTSVPGAANNQVLRWGGSGTRQAYQNTGHSWAGADSFDIFFNALTPYYATSASTLKVSLVEDGTSQEVWSDSISLALHPEAPSNNAYPYSDWTDGTGGSPDTTFNYTIASSIFSGGTAGEELRLVFSTSSSADGPIWLDNVSFTVVPEPSSFALLAGLFSLGWIMVRRRA